MTDSAPPQLGDLHINQSEMHIPTLSSSTTTSHPTVNGNSNASLQNAKDVVYDNTQAAAKAVQNSQVTQGIKETVNQGELQHNDHLLSQLTPSGPVVENIKNQHAKTTSEFRDLANSRTTPKSSAATGQPLTHYHSFFYNLLSWKNPRATALSFLSTILFILAARYLPAIRLAFKGLYLILGVTATAEIVGKLVVSRGLTSSFRPTKYYTIPRESLEASLEDAEQLVNFFVIEFQRVLFAENVLHTVAAFSAALISYWLIKIVPFWGLSLIGATILYLAPLIYITNKEVIDHQVANASHIVNSQANQVKDLAGQHTARATDAVKQYTADYTSKASEYIGSARSRSKSPELSSKPKTAIPTTSGPNAPPSYSHVDFPHAPQQEPLAGVTSHEDQYKNSPFGGQTVAVS